MATTTTATTTNARLQAMPATRWRTLSFKRAVTGWACAIPIILYELFWVILPIIFAFSMVFVNWRGFEDLSRVTFVGLENLREMTKDMYYIRAYRNSFLYAIVVVVGHVTIGLALALVIDKVTRGAGLARIIFYMPVILPGVAMALLWGMLYQPTYGLFNQTLMRLGLPKIPWLTDPNMALFSVCIYVLWKGTGGTMILCLAGLKSIPLEFYEAARIDGANAWQVFRHMTLPLLKPTLVFVTTTGLIGSLQVFDTVYVMTQGGPAGSTTTVVYHMYHTAFNFFRTSYATSMAVGLFIVILLMTRLQIKLYGEGGLTSYYG